MAKLVNFVRQESAVGLALLRPVRRRALRISLAVGTILAIINHGDTIFWGSISQSDAIRIAVTYVVPYCVSTLSSVMAIRELQTV
ncbi:nitrate/nitrite transporter NrtS [Octadecabacter antarcticus]|uniref:nitrate/nitrite transporter NrtS n=1 Tax=Octadecabacter antarcticus TaxID=1217908 RepID=UPI001651A382